MMQCPTCNTLFRSGARYCPEDGTTLRQVSGAAEAPSRELVTQRIPREAAPEAAGAAGADTQREFLPHPLRAVATARQNPEPATNRPQFRATRRAGVGLQPAALRAALVALGVASCAAVGLALGALNAQSTRAAAAEPTPAAVVEPDRAPVEVAPAPEPAVTHGPFGGQDAPEEAAVPEPAPAPAEVKRPASPATAAKPAAEKSAGRDNPGPSRRVKGSSRDDDRGSRSKCSSEKDDRRKSGRKGIRKRVVYYDEDEE
jgi:hypothetical protein